MLPSSNQFARDVGALGVAETDTIVVYDGLGLFSAPRVWWTFRLFGAEKVFILEGGSFLTLKFGEPGAGGDDALGAYFTSINGGKPDFKANLQDVLIGPGLAFVQMLASFALHRVQP